MEAETVHLELAALRQAIQQEENTELDHTITRFLSLKNNVQQQLDVDADRKQQKHHNTALFSLFCLKVTLEFQLISRRDFSCQEDLRSDIDRLFSLAQRIEYKSDLTDAIISDVLDLLTALYPLCEDFLPDFTEHYLPSVWRNARPTTSAMHRLFNGSVKYYLQTSRNLPAYQLLESLCRCSKIRDTEKQYQQLVINVLSFLNDSAPEVECRICHSAEPLFAQEQTERAGSFYWLYGCCLEKESQWSDAQTCFDQCYAIRQRLYGENNWFTAVARRESAMIAYSYTDPGSTEPYNLLLDFVHGLQAQNYTDLPQNQDLVHQIEGKTLYILLSGPQFAYIADLQRYAALLRRYTQICQQYHTSGIPLLNLRLTWNLWGNYYVQTGDLIQAEACFQRALAFHARSGAPEILTDAQVKSNLLMTYYIQNDIQHALPLLDELLEEESFSTKDSLRVFLFYIGIHLQTYSEMNPDEVAELKDYLQAICQTFSSHDTPLDSTAELVTLLVVSIIYFIQTDLISQDELDSYWFVLQTLEPSLPHLGLTSYQCIYFYYCETLMASLLFPQRTEALLQKALYYLQRCNATASTTGAVYQLAASLHVAQPSLCLHDADVVLRTITEEWHSSVRYSNDSRLSQSLALAQILFNGCYASLRCCLPDHTLYEKVLSFKSLASLAGRERNKVIHAGTVDTLLVSRIGELQNQIAALHAQALFRDTEQESAALDAELRRLEADFALKFLYKLPFVSITLPHVLDAIPNHSLVLEYFATTRHPSLDDTCDPLEIDLFVLSKENSQTSLERLVLSEGSSILQMADTFTQILQDMATGKSTIAQEAERERLRLALYRALLKPVVPKIAPGQTIYIAPDNTLTNLPFELLYEDVSPLADQHHMVKLECARDFLFHTRVSRGHGSLIIGCPAYTVQHSSSDFTVSADSEVRRSLLTDLTLLPPLPFAELEAQQVAASLHTLPKTGIFASKQLVLDATGYSVIHIATHGFFDLREESNALYSSCLFFAGVADWARTGQNSACFGNGILTADEISRLDLRSVELVVLSSCLNGMNNLYTGKEFEGMVGAFAAAGAGYVVASLWNVAESAGIVLLMELFYNYYIQEHLSPPAALNKAKHTLRHITVGQLRQQGWFHSIRRRQISGPVQQRIDQLERCPDRQRPFKNELFWGGFICYQCNNF